MMRLTRREPFWFMDEQRKTLDALEESDRKVRQLAAILGDVLLAPDLESARAAVTDALPDWTILGQPFDEPEKWRPLLGQIIAQKDPPSRRPRNE